MDSMVRAPAKIGLLDHLGGGNLGDDATLDAVMQNIKNRWPDSVIFGFSMNPSDTQARHGIPSYPIRTQTWSFGDRPGNSSVTVKTRVKAALTEHRVLTRLLKAFHTVAARIPKAFCQELVFLAKSFRIIRSFDFLIISGGGQLLDSWGGPWKFPYTLFKWVLLAKLSRVKCYFINVGAGPLNHPLSRWFVRRALLLANYVSFRDDNSRTLVQEIGFTGTSHVVADSVYSLDISASGANRGARRAETIVGFSPMAYCDPRVYWEKNQDVYNCFIRNLGLFGSWLLRYHDLMLFSTDLCLDSLAIEDLQIAIRNTADIANSRSLTREPITALDNILNQISLMDYVVTCRFHGVVFAHMLNKPVLAISHHPKVSALMNDLGLAKYCVDIRSCDLSVLTETFGSLVSNSEDIKSRMAERLAYYKLDLSIQFDALFPEAPFESA
jgi:polysaccharide pyruvyl transferase WcaK-like protein